MRKEHALSLQERVAMEAVALLSLGGTAADTRLHEEGVPLIGEAWGLPADATLRQLDLILREKTAVRRQEAGEDARHVLKDEEILHCATGLEILAMTSGLFETAVRLDGRQERQTLFDLAGELEQALNLDEWIIKAEGEEDAPPQTAGSAEAEGGPAA